MIRANPVLIVSILLALVSMAFVPPSKEYIEYIDAPMLCILFCLMASVAGMSVIKSISPARVAIEVVPAGTMIIFR